MRIMFIKDSLNGWPKGYEVQEIKAGTIIDGMNDDEANGAIRAGVAVLCDEDGKPAEDKPAEDKPSEPKAPVKGKKG